MGNTPLQNRRERLARLCDKIAGKRSDSGKQLRATNRRVDKKKKRT